ncbi:protein kinase [Nocardia amamiensis]|uniref:non-specific serine/threonine protein kinase n=1 Tax=Nocardia amamiensis TaxID=404578 RepID=A0ABS0CJP3_9NOCA|nr:serine/threonine-protein kinase [Nocardia amamiensis]MBF6296829.1 protein kinase [Nocardia amamiensis]
MLNSGAVFAGFTIEKLLGQGGMGSVYLARHPRLPRQTALKLLNRELFADAEVRARFEREADLAAQLDHPNIVAVYDRGTEDEQLWISMQYVDGVDAATVHPPTLPPERAVQIVEGVAAALDYAHGMGVLHRDVKPANIMLARSVGGHGERVFLTDFGIARLREDSTHLTQTGMFTATLAYASPEQMTGAHLDHRSDQYSLACALYWLLTGVAPFDAAAPAEIIRGHLQLPPPSAAAVRPGLSAALDAVIAKAMAKRPDDRYTSCVEFATAARRALTAPAPTIVASQYQPQPAPTVIAQPSSPAYPGPEASSPTYAAAGSGPAYTAPPQYVPNPTAEQNFPKPEAPAVAPPSYAAVPQQPSHLSMPPNYPAAQAVSPSYPAAQAMPPNTPPPMGYAPHQPPGYPPERRSHTGLIVMVVLIVVALLGGVGIVAAKVGFSNSDSASPLDLGTKTPTGPADPGMLAKAFPNLLPQGVDTKYNVGSGPGYRDKTCFLNTAEPGDKVSAADGVPDFPNWATAWNCWGTPINEPDYVLVAFKSPQDAQAAVRDLPSNTAATERNNGKSYSTYRWQTSGGGLPDGFLVVEFEDDPARSSYLLFATVTLTDRIPTSGFGMPAAEFEDWFADLPL